MYKTSLRKLKWQWLMIVAIVQLSLPIDSVGTPKPKRNSLDQIKTIVVIYAENRSFDNLYGLFPGANGVLKNADGSPTNPDDFKQLDRDGFTHLSKLPKVWNASGIVADSLSFIANLPNAPFRIDAPPGTVPGGLQANKITPDLVHRFYNNQMQINGGKNNMFAAWCDAGGITMGYYDGSSMKMWKLAQQYTLCDNFFMGAFGGSFLNHFWLISAQTPVYPNAPANLISKVDSTGVKLSVAESSPASALTGAPVYVADKPLTPDGYAVNTVQPPFQPSGIPPAQDGDNRIADVTKNPLPPQVYKTIGDVLSAKKVTWSWYSGAWNDALNNRAVINNSDPASSLSNLQTHHQPFNFFKRFDPTTPDGAKERKLHLKDYSDLEKDIAKGKLPTVVFYKPQGHLNQHSGYADVMSGDAHVAEVVTRLQKSPQWKHMAIIVTYDENGGYWDHVAPPREDRWGPGMRIPAIVISPFAKTHTVDHTYYDTTSILRFIIKRFKLESLPGIRQNAGDMTNAFTFSK